MESPHAPTKTEANTPLSSHANGERNLLGVSDSSLDITTVDIGELFGELQAMLTEALPQQQDHQRPLDMSPVGGARWREVHSRYQSPLGLSPCATLETTSSQEVAELQAALQQSSAALKASQLQLQALSGRVEELQIQLEAECRAMMEAMQAECAKTRVAHTQDVAELQERLRQQKAETDREAAAAREAAQAAVAEAAVAAAEAAAAAAASRQEDLEQRRDELTTRVNDMEKQLAWLQTAMASVEQQREGLAARVEQLESQLAVVVAERNALTQRLADVEVEAAERAEAQAGAARVCGRVFRDVEHEAEVGHVAEGLREELHRVQAEAAESLSEARSQATLERAALSAQLTAAEVAREELGGQLAAERAEKEALAAALSTARSEAEARPAAEWNQLVGRAERYQAAYAQLQEVLLPTSQSVDWSSAETQGQSSGSAVTPSLNAPTPFCNTRTAKAANLDDDSGLDALDRTNAQLIAAARALQAAIREQRSITAAALAFTSARDADAVQWRAAALAAAADTAASKVALEELRTAAVVALTAGADDSVTMSAELELRQVQVTELTATATDLSTQVLQLRMELASMAESNNALQAEALAAGAAQVALRVAVDQAVAEAAAARMCGRVFRRVERSAVIGEAVAVGLAIKGLRDERQRVEARAAETLAEARSHAAAERAALSVQLTAAEAAREELGGQLAAERAEKDVLAAALSTARSEMEELRQHYTELLASMRYELEATLGSLAERDALKQQLADTAAKAKAALAAARNEAAVERAEARDELQRLRAVATEAETARKVLEAQLVEAEVALAAARVMAAVEREEAQDKLQRLLAAMGEVAEAETARKSLEAQMAETEAAQKGLEAKLADAEGERKGLEAKLAKADVACRAFEAQVVEAEAALVAARNEAAEERAEARDELQRLRTEVAEADAARKGLEAQVAEAEVVQKGLQAQVAEVEAARSVLEAQVAQTEAARKGLEAQLAEAAAALAAARKEAAMEQAKAQDELQRLQVEVAQTEAARRGLETQLAEAAAALAAARTEAAMGQAKAQDELQRLQVEIAQTEAARKDLEAQLAGTEASQKGLEAHVAVVEAAQRGLEAQLAEAAAALAAARKEAGMEQAKAQDELQRLQVEVAQTEAARKGLEAQLAESEAAQKGLQAQVAVVEAARKGLEAQLADAEAAQKGLEAHVVEVEAARKGLEAQVEELHEELRQVQTREACRKEEVAVHAQELASSPTHLEPLEAATRHQHQQELRQQRQAFERQLTETLAKVERLREELETQEGVNQARVEALRSMWEAERRELRRQLACSIAQEAATAGPRGVVSLSLPQSPARSPRTGTASNIGNGVGRSGSGRTASGGGASGRTTCGLVERACAQLHLKNTGSGGGAAEALPKNGDSGASVMKSPSGPRLVDPEIPSQAAVDNTADVTATMRMTRTGTAATVVATAATATPAGQGNSASGDKDDAKGEAADDVQVNDLAATIVAVYQAAKAHRVSASGGSRGGAPGTYETGVESPASPGAYAVVMTRQRTNNSKAFVDDDAVQGPQLMIPEMAYGPPEVRCLPSTSTAGSMQAPTANEQPSQDDTVDISSQVKLLVQRVMRRAECAALLSELDAVRQVAVAATADAAAHATAHNNVRRRLTALSTSYNRVSGELELLRAAHEEIRVELGPVRRTAERLRHENTVLRRQLEEVRHDSETLCAALEALEVADATVQDLQRRCMAAEVEMEQQQQASALHARIDCLTTELASAADQLQGLEAERERLTVALLWSGRVRPEEPLSPCSPIHLRVSQSARHSARLRQTSSVPPSLSPFSSSLERPWPASARPCRQQHLAPHLVPHQQQQHHEQLHHQLSQRDSNLATLQATTAEVLRLAQALRGPLGLDGLVEMDSSVLEMNTGTAGQHRRTLSAADLLFAHDQDRNLSAVASYGPHVTPVASDCAVVLAAAAGSAPLGLKSASASGALRTTVRNMDAGVAVPKMLFGQLLVAAAAAATAAAQVAKDDVDATCVSGSAEAAAVDANTLHTVVDVEWDVNMGEAGEGHHADDRAISEAGTEDVQLYFNPVYTDAGVQTGSGSGSGTNGGSGSGGGAGRSSSSGGGKTAPDADDGMILKPWVSAHEPSNPRHRALPSSSLKLPPVISDPNLRVGGAMWKSYDSLPYYAADRTAATDLRTQSSEAVRLAGSLSRLAEPSRWSYGPGMAAALRWRQLRGRGRTTGSGGGLGGVGVSASGGGIIGGIEEDVPDNRSCADTEYTFDEYRNLVPVTKRNSLRRLYRRISRLVKD